MGSKDNATFRIAELCVKNQEVRGQCFPFVAIYLLNDQTVIPVRLVLWRS